jgi:hypothetical protein
LGFEPMSSVVGEVGHGGKATAVERVEVERLRAEGVSIRKIAERVFGDVRFRGRVERILGRPALMPPLPVELELEDVDFDALDGPALTRLLVERKLRHWAKSGKTPPAAELKSLFEVQRQLGALEQLDRLKALHRQRRGDRARPG